MLGDAEEARESRRALQGRRKKGEAEQDEEEEEEAEEGEGEADEVGERSREAP
jgi:hypothetical protein